MISFAEVSACCATGFELEICVTMASVEPPKSSKTTSEIAGSVTVPLVPAPIDANLVVRTYLPLKVVSAPLPPPTGGMFTNDIYAPLPK
jgi:hypothetical protein